MQEVTNSSDSKFVEEAFTKDWPVAATFYHPGECIRIMYSIYVLCRSWIVGALESAKRAIQQFVLKTLGTETVEYIFLSKCDQFKLFSMSVSQ